MTRLPLSEVEHALTLTDPREAEQARLEALRALMSGPLARPVHVSRWRAMRALIDAELGRRAALERRSADAVLHDELAAAITLAAESARLIAMRAYVAAFSRELRLRTADELLTSLCGHHRADGPRFESLDSVSELVAPDETEAADLAHLWSRLPVLAQLTATETAALRRELAGEDHTAASRQALSRGRRKIRALEK